MLPGQTSTEGPTESRRTTGNQTPRHHFLHPDIVSRVVCHTAQIRIHSVLECGKQPPVLLPSAGGAPIDPGGLRLHQGLPSVEGESGLATQRRTLNDYGLTGRPHLHRRGLGQEHAPTLMEGRSAGSLKSGDTVVVPRIDRLARNLTEGLKTIEELHAHGINIRSLAEGLDTGDDSPTARLMLHMLLSLAEWERDTIRDRIRDRIRAGVDRAAAEGRTGGRPPALSSEKVEAVKGFPGERRVGQRRGAARTFGVSRPTVRAVRYGTYAVQYDITWTLPGVQDGEPHSVEHMVNP